MITEDQLHKEVSLFSQEQLEDLMLTGELEQDQCELVMYEFGLRLTGMAWPSADSNMDYQVKFGLTFAQACTEHDYVFVADSDLIKRLNDGSCGDSRIKH